LTTDSTVNDTNLYSRYRGLSLGIKILIWMGIGIVVGIVFGNDAEVVQPIGDLFIRLLFMSAIPLVFFNLIAGVTSLTGSPRVQDAVVLLCHDLDCSMYRAAYGQHDAARDRLAIT